MKFGKTLMQLAQELERQNNAKHDYLVDSRNLEFGTVGDESQIALVNPTTNTKQILRVNDYAHRQIGTFLGIPAKYYDTMRQRYPDLLAQNINGWFNHDPSERMVRTLDGAVRAVLSPKYRRIDNYQVAETVLPIIAQIKDARIESCEVTETKMYIKVVNERLTAEVTPGDVVQSGILISNSEVGAGSMAIQPLVYRLVCSNGMVVNDAATRKYHVGRRAVEANDDFSIYADETLKADDRALMLKVRDTVQAVVSQVQFDKVVDLMRTAKEAKITTKNIPGMVELANDEYGFSKREGESILNHLIRGNDLTLYGLANAVTRAAQDVDGYDRSTDMESLGYSVLGMSRSTWNKLNRVE